MKSLTLIAAISLFSPLGFATTIESVDAAANQLDVQTLEQLSQQASGYTKAYADYRLAISANLRADADKAEAALEQAVDILTPAEDAESKALLAAVYGMQIGMNPLKGMTLGPKAGSTLDDAAEIEPTNPRVLLVRAISAYNTPAIFGGGPGNAIEFSNQAIASFRQPCNDICWGHAEAYTWRGLAKQQLGDQQGALNDWQQALQTNPDYGWAKFLLSQAAR